jgi:histidine triad nucleotide-binding protein 1
MSTIFKKIIDKEIPANIVYEDDDFLAFHDINPAAKVHVLVIPKKEIRNLDAATEEDLELLGKLQLTVAKVARILGINEDGYRVVTNINKNGGQEVYHIHYHILGGEPMGMKVR